MGRNTLNSDKYTNPVTRLLFGVVCCMLWGSAFPGIKLGYEWLVIDGAGSQILFAGLRFTMAGIFTFCYGLIVEAPTMKIRRQNLLPLIGHGIIQTAIAYIFFYVGVAHMTGAKSSIINSTGAFFSLLFAGLVLRTEKITSRKWLACILGFAGVVAINLGNGGMGGGFTLLGDGCIIISAVSSGIGTVTSKGLASRESPVAVTAYQLFTGGVIMIVLGLALGGRVYGFELKSVLLLLYLAGLSTYAFIIWTKLLKFNPAGKISVYGFMTPIFGVFLSGLLLGENVMTVQNVMGLALVCAGVLIVNSDKSASGLDRVVG